MDFLIFFLVYHYFTILFYKWELPSLIKQGQRIPLLGRFFYNLSSCEFCMENHLAFTYAACIYYFHANSYVFVFAVMATALSNLIKTVSHARVQK